MEICQENHMFGYNWTRTVATSHKDLSMFYCCQKHKYAIRALLCNKQYFHVLQQYTHSALLHFHCNTGYANVTQC